jgi:hypothetical protein
VLADGAEGKARQGKSAELVVTELHGRYFEQTYRSNTFLLSAAGATPTAYVGAAGGTPLLAIHNPPNSNRIAVLLAVGFAHRAGGSAAGATSLNVWSGPSVTPTGTQTTPTSVYSQSTGDSAMRGFVNTALTGSTALALALPLYGYQIIGATPVSQSETGGLFDVKGLIVAVPGNQITVGLSVVVTSLTAEIAWYWEEVAL